MTAALLPAPDGGAAPLSRRAGGDTPAGVPEPVRRPYLVPVPDCEPPFDDEIGRCPHHGRADCVADEPTPRFQVRHGTWYAPGRTPPPDRSVDTSRSTVPGSDASRRVVPAPVAPVPASPAPAPAPIPSGADARATRPAAPAVGSADHSARLLARALIEVLAGHRPAAQLRTFCTPATFAALDRRGRHPSPALPHVLSVRVCEPADGIAEAAAVYRRGDRVRVVAFRLERLADPTAPTGSRWTLTAVQPG